HDNEALFQYNDAWKVVGSSNGLVCVFSYLICKDALLLLVNPWTREVRELPMAPLLPKKTEPYEVSASFGYDSSSDDYKVVMGYKKKNVEDALVQVLSLKSNTWKLIGHINYWF
ncbi:F-box protein CPR1-like protein, partial [Tanacetum coccineum]